MESLITAIVNNGLGVGSFIALIWFMNMYLSKMNTILTNISNTLISVKENLDSLSTRVSDIEEKIKK